MQLFKKENIFLITTILAVVLCVVFFGQYLVAVQGQKTCQETIKLYQHNEKILSFTKMFVAKVLKATSPISIEDQLNLEKAVRDIDSKPIYDQWKKFIEAKTQVEAQTEVKNLLDILVERVTY